MKQMTRRTKASAQLRIRGSPAKRILSWPGQWTNHWETPGGSASSKDTLTMKPPLVHVSAVVGFLRLPMRDLLFTSTHGRRSENRETPTGRSDMAGGRKGR